MIMFPSLALARNGGIMEPGSLVCHMVLTTAVVIVLVILVGQVFGVLSRKGFAVGLQDLAMSDSMSSMRSMETELTSAACCLASSEVC